MKLVSIKPSTRSDKKLMAEFDDGTVTHFGAKGYTDFTQTGDESKKAAYLKRHRVNENWNDPKSAGALSRFILWNKPTISASIKDFKNRFSL